MTKPTQRARSLSVIALCIGLIAPATAQGQSVDPQRALAGQALYNEATKEMDAKNYAKACPMLEKVIQILPESIAAKLELAECYVESNKLASAWSQYTLVEQMTANKEQHIQHRNEAHEKAAELWKKLATLVIEVPDDVRSIPGLTITCDGVPLNEAQWGTPLPVNEGGHEVVLTAPGREPRKEKIEVGANLAKARLKVNAPSLGLAPVAKPKVAPPIKARLPPPKRQWQRPLGIAVMGAGATGIVVGAVLGVLAISKKDESNSDNHCDVEDRCDATGLDMRTKAFDLGNGSTAAFAVGVPALVGGGVLFFTAPPSGATQERAGTKGSGIRMGFELTPGLVRVKGAW